MSRLLTPFFALFLAGINVTTAATDEQWTDLAEKSVRQVLKDSASAQFQSETVRHEASLKFPVMCGEVTGQTLTGLERGSSYSGYKKFVADPNTSKILVLDPLDVSGVGQRNADFETEWAHYCEPVPVNSSDPSISATPSGPNDKHLGFELKGVTLGERATPQQIEQRFAPQENTENAALIPTTLKVKCGLGANNWQVCNGMTSVADVIGHLNLVIDERGIVQRMNVTFPAIGFAQVKDAVLTKLGSAQTHKHVVDQNRFGATFDDEVLEWKDEKKNEVLLKQYAGDLDYSILSFTTQMDRDSSASVTKGHSNDL